MRNFVTTAPLMAWLRRFCPQYWLREKGKRGLFREGRAIMC
jgi:hypothetical protein